MSLRVKARVLRMVCMDLCNLAPLPRCLYSHHFGIHEYAFLRSPTADRTDGTSCCALTSIAKFMPRLYGSHSGSQPMAEHGWDPTASALWEDSGFLWWKALAGGLLIGLVRTFLDLCCMLKLLLPNFPPFPFSSEGSELCHGRRQSLPPPAPSLFSLTTLSSVRGPFRTV